MRRIAAITLTAILITNAPLTAQESEDRTLLPQEQMTAIINEVSGERAMASVLELVPYQRVRPASEYQGSFRETRVVKQLAEEFGFKNVTVDTIGADKKAWQPEVGELWMETPKSVKLFDIQDIALSLVSLSASGNLSGALVDVGAGREIDFEGKDVKGKFVLASSSPSNVYDRAVERGALGVLAVSAVSPQRAIDYPRQIVHDEVEAKPGTVAWAVTPEVRQNLLSFLERGHPVTISSKVRSVEVSGKEEIVHAQIPGDGSTSQEVGISCHLYEGLIKQGANDDNSGCALILETGRAYIKLINEGKLPRPKRTINFQFVPEIRGTAEFLKKYPEKARNMIGTLNFDMEALRLSDSRSYWILQRTPDSFPSYLNDIPQSMMEYVADITRERLRFRRGLNGYAPTQPVESPRGSKDPFYVKIDKHYGASDHVIYMQNGVPAVMFITWPDMWYHSSDDTPDKQDPTQYKRAATVALGSLAVLATGTDAMAEAVLNENLGRGLARMGEAHTKALGYLSDAAPGNLADAYKEARTAVQHQGQVEAAVLKSARVMWTDAGKGQSSTDMIARLIDQRSQALIREVDTVYALKARASGAAPARAAKTRLEEEAARIMVKPGPKYPRDAYFPPRGPGPHLPDEFMAEFSLLIARGNMTALEIRDFLSGEFTPVPLADVMAALKGREEAGLVSLTKK
ncbi:M28 family peptidase [Sphingopyxis sp. LARHCG72]